MWEPTKRDADVSQQDRLVKVEWDIFWIKQVAMMIIQKVTKHFFEKRSWVLGQNHGEICPKSLQRHLKPSWFSLTFAPVPLYCNLRPTSFIDSLMTRDQGLFQGPIPETNHRLSLKMDGRGSDIQWFPLFQGGLLGGGHPLFFPRFFSVSASRFHVMSPNMKLKLVLHLLRGGDHVFFFEIFSLHPSSQQKNMW